MTKEDSIRKLEQLWEKGVERANEEQPPKPLEEDAINAAAGFPVRSGAKAGAMDYAQARTSRTACPTLQC